jgi:hypothetical protein
MFTKNNLIAMMVIMMMPFMAMAQTERVNQTMKVQSFNAIHSSGTASVELIKSDHFEVSISAHPKNLPYVKVSSENGVLHISEESGYNPRLGIAEIVVQMPEDLNSIRISGAGEVRSADTWNLSHLRVSVAGSGNVSLEGAVNDLSLTVAGSGGIRFSKLIAEAARVSLSGSGVVSVHATRNLKLSLDGSGNIVYFGNPSVFDQSVSGSGRIRKA